MADPVFAPSYDPNFPFGSEAANLEYSILSAILGNPSPPDSSNTPPPDFWPSVPYNPPFLTYPYQDQPQPQPQSDPSQQPDTIQPELTELSPDASTTVDDLESLHPLQPRFPLDARPRSPPLFVDVISDSVDTPASNLQTINDRITKPYDYTEGYHFLMKHLPSRSVAFLSFDTAHRAIPGLRRTISCASSVLSLSSDRHSSPFKCLFL